jgi:hypothetical protein
MRWPGPLSCRVGGGAGAHGQHVQARGDGACGDGRGTMRRRPLPPSVLRARAPLPLSRSRGARTSARAVAPPARTHLLGGRAGPGTPRSRARSTRGGPPRAHDGERQQMEGRGKKSAGHSPLSSLPPLVCPATPTRTPTTLSPSPPPPPPPPPPPARGRPTCRPPLARPRNRGRGPARGRWPATTWSCVSLPAQARGGPAQG